MTRIMLLILVRTCLFSIVESDPQHNQIRNILPPTLCLLWGASAVCAAALVGSGPGPRGGAGAGPDRDPAA